MGELSRPDPSPTLGVRLRSLLDFVGVARLATAAASAVLVAGATWWLLHSPAPPVERALPVAGSDPVTAAAEPPAAATDPGLGADGGPAGVPATVVVQAAGAVMVPGVYVLPAGARVHELLVAAGGPAPGAAPDALALATVLVDGQRVQVPFEGEPVVGPASAVGPAGAATGPLDVNRATAAELDELPGVGPSTAAAIVEHRERNGPFATVDDLLDVRGIGPAKLDGFRGQVTV